MKKTLGVIGLATVLACLFSVSSASAVKITPETGYCQWIETGEWVCQ